VTIRRFAAVVLAAMTATCLSASAHADDIKVVASGAIKLALEQLIPVFEQSSGHTVKVLYGPAGAIAKRVESGDPADVAIVTRAQLDSLVTQGKIVAGSGVGFASATIGVAIRKGAPRPDISTVDAGPLHRLPRSKHGLDVRYLHRAHDRETGHRGGATTQDQTRQL
jgi:molybdate transport system substrate-binding protein